MNEGYEAHLRLGSSDLSRSLLLSIKRFVWSIRLAIKGMCTTSSKRLLS